MCFWSLVGDVKIVKSSWTGTVYIRANGSIDPPSAPITTSDNITYTLTDNITSSDSGIIIERNDIVIDGAGFQLAGAGSGIGINLSNRINVSIRNITIINFQTGIYLDNSNDSTLIQNNIKKSKYGVCLSYSKNNHIENNHISANNESGICLSFSSLNIIDKNNVTGNLHAFFLEFSRNNTISGNSIINNQYGVFIYGSNNSMFYHNNFVNNSLQVFDWGWDPAHPLHSINFWDDGYPSGGNYWSNYAGIDLCSGQFQNETGSDGIGDSKFRIDMGSGTSPELMQFDNYPLMGMFYDFEVIGIDNKTYHVQVVSNSTVSDLNLVIWLSSPNEYLQPGQEFLLFYVEGESHTSGFCRVAIPRALLNGSYIVLVDWTIVPTRQLVIPNSTHAYLYFTYNHTKHEVIIIPEFTLTAILPLFLATMLIAIIPLQTKHRTPNKLEHLH